MNYLQPDFEIVECQLLQRLRHDRPGGRKALRKLGFGR
jgi:hypothetical protein